MICSGARLLSMRLIDGSRAMEVVLPSNWYVDGRTVGSVSIPVERVRSVLDIVIHIEYVFRAYHIQ